MPSLCVSKAVDFRGRPYLHLLLRGSPPDTHFPCAICELKFLCTAKSQPQGITELLPHWYSGSA